MIKKFIFPVLFAIIAFFIAPMLGPEVNGATTFFLVAIGIGLGVILNFLLFCKSTNENKSK